MKNLIISHLLMRRCLVVSLKESYEKLYVIFIIVVFLFLLGCIFSPYILPAKVSAIYQGNYYDDFNDKDCWSTIVLVDNPPFTKNGRLESWRKEAPLLKNKYKLLEKIATKYTLVKIIL